LMGERTKGALRVARRSDRLLFFAVSNPSQRSGARRDR
jgi:hypothetical protein